MEPRPVLVLACVMLALGLPRVALPAQSIRVLSDTPVSIGLTQPLVEPHLASTPCAPRIFSAQRSWATTAPTCAPFADARIERHVVP